MIPRRIKETKAYQRVRAFTERYERWLMPGMLLAGTVFDAITFKTLQISTTFLLQGIYLVIAGGGIVFSHVYDGHLAPPTNFFVRYLRLAAVPIVQFTIGALLSTSLVFYWFSGAVSISWPFFALIAILMASNEFLRHYFLRQGVQVAVFGFILFSYCSLLFPYLFNSLAAWVFVLAGVVGTIFSFLYIFFFVRFTPATEQDKTRMIAVSVTIFVVMNVLYFVNIIPPIPLALRDAGVYHNIIRTGGEYTLVGEDESWLDKLIPGQTIHTEPGESIYVYSAIFAPTDLSTTIYHRWQYYDEESRQWENRDRLSFVISGGRDEGFRGYSRKTSLTPGKWRVTVETARGQALGRIHFSVVNK